MHDYELTFIVRSDVEEPDLMPVADRVKGLITDNGGEVSKVDLWGTRRLAYPIKNKWDGQFVFMRAKLPTKAVAEVDRALNVMEEVIRHLFVRVDE